MLTTYQCNGLREGGLAPLHICAPPAVHTPARVPSARYPTAWRVSWRLMRWRHRWAQALCSITRFGTNQTLQGGLKAMVHSLSRVSPPAPLSLS